MGAEVWAKEVHITMSPKLNIQKALFIALYINSK